MIKAIKEKQLENQYNIRQKETEKAINNIKKQAAAAVVKYRDKGVVGFDIAGPEDGFPPTNQLETFEYLRKENAHFTIHAGEAYGLPSIWEAIQICGAERLGHGVRIIDDIDFSGDKPKLGPLASYVRDRRIPLELCPTSNLQTGAAKTYSEHPIGILAKLRFRVTLNTDNRLMSRTSMSNEMSECVTCGKQDHWKKQQAGHFISRKHYATRWDEDNVQVQCSGCNVFRYGEQYLFSKYLGTDLSEQLLVKSRKIQKFTDNELLDMIDLYTKKVNNLLI